MLRIARNGLVLLGAMAWVVGVGCSGDSDRGETGDGPGEHAGSGGDGDGDGGGFGNPEPQDIPDGGFDGGSGNLELTLSPDHPTLRIVQGEDLPTLQFEVKSRSEVVPATFKVENGELGHIGDDGLFTPSGSFGGATRIEARVGEHILQTTLTIEIEWTQNGADPANPGMTSAGGYGGVGGEGPGGPVSDELKETLAGEPTEDDALAFIYPYDQTVFPLGLLAPLMMWSPGTATAAEGIVLHLSGSGFEYTGYFGRPAALADDADFVRHPIPQEVWSSATQTVAGGKLNVELSVAKDGKVYGPMKQSWKIAKGSLKGTVYYQSYGTNLAKNYGGAQGVPDGLFGGATLAIKPGAIEPELVAGANGGQDQCRVCHSVSSDGSRMTVQHGGDNDTTSSYDLLNGNAESGYAAELRSQLAWIGMTPDGAYGLSNGEPLAVGGDPVTQLYDMETGEVVPTTGLSELVREAAFPAFAHDGQKVAFNFFNGIGDATIGMGDGKKLVSMDFEPSMNAFSNPQLLYEGDLPAGWPSFSPTGTGVVFQVLTESHGPLFETRNGNRAELWWTNLRTNEAHRLDRLNGIESGMSYLPNARNNHENDVQLNYEPTVAPVAAGGYAWIVFTSRRLYGNVATIDPWFSDPREHDLTETPTPKKLWVAAIDLDIETPELTVRVGDDPSHPAFYLPGQELLAGNARGFWVVDPCKADGKSCESGVECCTGYCQEDEEGELTCGQKIGECSGEYDRCDTKADCCDDTNVCVNHVCSVFSVE